ncbi:MAG: aminotransferase class V-fold PLP-dependent enzyme [Candidatus Peribacteria bacterium]|nr:MAG: aminotransferase class V-fold PLP-dependent enzyme [Candidatus Peribacteria bacterium]
MSLAFKKKRTSTRFIPPQQLKQELDLSLGEHGHNDQYIINLTKQIMEKSVATQDPLFFNQLFAGADIYGIVGVRLNAVANSSMYTYEMSPVFTLMEQEIFANMAKLLKWESKYDGLMLPGGSAANQYAIQLARYKLNPAVHQTGIYQQAPYVIFTSDQAHYSITKSAMLLGLGKDSVIKIPTDTGGSMLIEKLEEAIQEAQAAGKQLLMINATAGTTVLGAFDNLRAIATLAQKYGIWLHVDAALGGCVLFSDQLRKLVDGTELVDSFTINPHKALGAPLQCTIFMTQQTSAMATCNTLKVDYLFQEDKGYDISCDNGDKYVQCGRKVDALKFWLMWKARGSE